MDRYSMTALCLAGATLLTACAGGLLRHTSRTGRLKRNSRMAVRTRATLSSDEAWELGHHAAEPHLGRAAQFGFVAAAVTVLLVTWSPGMAPVALAVSILGLCGTAVLLVLAARTANSVATEVRTALEELR